MAVPFFRRGRAGKSGIPPLFFCVPRSLSCPRNNLLKMDMKERANTFMAEKLKIISLGGLNEIGKNLTVYEYGGDMIIVDVGMGFPDDDMYGIDVVIPDFSYLIKNKDRIRGIFLTHGHEDHIGSIPYLLRDVNVPIYATRMSGEAEAGGTPPGQQDKAHHL